MTILGASFPDVGVARVSDGEYHRTLLDLIRHSVGQCVCDIFIVDHELDRDPDLRVDRILVELAAAAWRGVETRLMIGGSRHVPAIRGATLLAWARARDLGVDARLASATKDGSSHVKLVIADDRVLTGSHNWTRGMFGDETQDSVLLEGSALAAALRTYFIDKWLSTAQDEYDVSL